MNIIWSDKQRKVLETVTRPGGGIVLVDGPVRSGKSFSAIAAFLMDIMKSSDTQFGVAAPSQKQIQNVFVETCLELGFPVKPTAGGLKSPRGNKIVSFPINKSDSRFAISGHTFGGMLVDETIFCYKKSIDFLIAVSYTHLTLPTKA